MTRIALFGGAFDPIHEGHLALARAALNAFQLDQVRLIPCASPVHKAACRASPWRRAAMVALAINQQPGLVLDVCELERTTPSYAIDTIEQLSARYDKAPHLYWLLGEDAVLTFKEWHRWQAVLARVDLVVVNRPGQDQDALNNLLAELKSYAQSVGHDVHRLTMPSCAHASQAIRNKSAPLTDLPDLVRRFIIAEHIYDEPLAVDKVRLR